MNQVGKNQLKKNYSTWAIFSIINNTKISEKPIVGWRIVGGKKVTVELYIRVIRKFRNEFVIRPVKVNGQKVLGDLIAGSEKLNLYLPADLVLCQSMVKKIDSNGDITISMPDMIAQIDRRKHLRLFRENGVRIGVEFKKELGTHTSRVQSFTKDCFDISAGGMSFIISRTEAKYFHKENDIESMILNLDGKKTKISGRVVNIFDVEPDDQNGLMYKSKKVCIQFSDPTAKQQKVINDYVFKYLDIEDAI
jgi:hypothetical protein